MFALTFPVIMLIMQLTSVVLVWFGGKQIESNSMPIGDLFAFIQYAYLILFSVLMATIMFVFVPRAAAAGERIQAVLDTVPSVVAPEQPVAGTVAAGLVELRDVEFRYPGAEEPVLSHISFTAQPGQMTAIVGSTGSGKSTLINLIPRLYDATAGAVLVDGVDVREYEPQDLWRRIGLVPQSAFLFSGSVADNLRYGRPDATDEELWHLSTSLRPPSSCGRCRRNSRRRSRRRGPACRAASASVWPSAGPWPSRPASTSSTTASRRWT